MVHPQARACIEASNMFKKSEEQEWTRLRAALSKDREEPGAATTVPDHPETNSAAGAVPPPGGQTTSAGPNFRSTPNDVNVGLAGPRPPPNPDGREAESLIRDRNSF